MNLPEEEKKLIQEWGSIYKDVKKDIAYLRSKEDKEKARALRNHIKRLKPRLKKIISKYEKGFFKGKAHEKRIDELITLLNEIQIKPNKKILEQTLKDLNFVLNLMRGESKTRMNSERIRKIVFWLVSAVMGFLLMKTSLVFKKEVELEKIKNKEIRIEISMLHHLAKKHSFEVVNKEIYKEFGQEIKIIQRRFISFSKDVDNFKKVFDEFLVAKDYERSKDLKRKLDMLVKRIKSDFSEIFDDLDKLGLLEEDVKIRKKIYVENVYTLILGLVYMLISLYGIHLAWKSPTKEDIDKQFEEMKKYYKLIINSQKNLAEKQLFKQIITQKKLDELKDIIIKREISGENIEQKIEEIKNILLKIASEEETIFKEELKKLRQLLDKIKKKNQ